VYLPAGKWYDWWTNEAVTGGRWVERPVDLATMPLYVKAGAIIPIDPVRQYTSETAAEPTTLRVYPGADGVFTMYDDDGQSQGYLDGSDAKIQWIRMSWDEGGKKLVLDAQRGWPAGITRTFKVVVMPNEGESRTLEFGGRRAELSF
jgi:alpha-glucosidase/alpha-D-xyloside xylohydrolase